MSPAPDPPRFGRVITAMVTPFDDAGALDLPAAVELARWLAAHGSDGLVLSGSTGESSVLTDEEKVALWQRRGRGRDRPGHRRHRLQRHRALGQDDGRGHPCGVDGVLVVDPYYNRPSQAGIYEHFRAVAEAAASLPVLLYDIPVRAGRRIATPPCCGWPARCPPSSRSRTRRGTRRRRRIWRRRRPAASRSTAVTTS